MEITEEEFMTAETEPSETEIIKEAWPIPPEDYTREFEEYLMEIGLRCVAHNGFTENRKNNSR